MIPRAFITEWREHAPWRDDAQVEQDLLITRALVEIYSVEGLRTRLAFRGGTALHKLHLQPASRYSEDIDLVQMRPEPIGETLDLLRAALDPWLGVPRRVIKEGRVSLVYRVMSEDATPLDMRLKVEINSREHFTELGLKGIPMEVHSPWYSGAAHVTTFDINELLGTKLRALYQRKKGRDLFDLWLALQREDVQPLVLVRCFERYLAEGGLSVSRAELEANLHEKASDSDFRDDILPLIEPTLIWSFEEAMCTVRERVVSLLRGDAWKGDGL